MDNCANLTGAIIQAPREALGWSLDTIKNWWTPVKEKVVGTVSGAVESVESGASQAVAKAKKGASWAKDHIAKSIGSSNVGADMAAGADRMFNKIRNSALAAESDASAGINSMVVDVGIGMKGLTKPGARVKSHANAADHKDKPRSGKPAGWEASERKRRQIVARDEALLKNDMAMADAEGPSENP